MPRTPRLVAALGLALVGSAPLFAHGAPAIPHMLVEYPSPPGRDAVAATVPYPLPSPMVRSGKGMVAAVARR